MKYWTLAEMRAKVNLDLDLQGEETVGFDEMTGYFNDGIDEAEGNIHNLNEDYFMADASIDLVANENHYVLPADIYGNKIRSIYYDNGSNRYTLTRIKMEDIPHVLPLDDYRYMIINRLNDGVNTVFGPRIRLFPAARETASGLIKVYYLRNAKRLVNETDECDIPEFASFVMAFAKAKAALKELHPKYEDYKAEAERLRGLMLESLVEMVPDGDNMIEGDLSLYDDHV